MSNNNNNNTEIDFRFRMTKEEIFNRSKLVVEEILFKMGRGVAPHTHQLSPGKELKLLSSNVSI